MFFGIAFGVSAGKRSGPPVATIVLSNSTIAENAALGAAVGTLSVINATGTPAFTLVDSAGSRFALSAANVQRGATALDYEAATSHNIIVSVTGMTPSPANATFNIQVTNIAEVPVLSVQPTLSPTSGVVGTLITCGTGTWTLSPTSYAYQWMRTGVDISGATSSTYTSVLADDTFTLTCKVLASNADGPAAGYSTTSNSHSVGASSLLLDSYSVGVAHSLRKLLTAYAGNCVRIRRSSDNSEQDFGFVSNVVDTAGIATFIGGGTGSAVTWYDQSGNSVNITHATAAWQPQFSASSIGGKPTLIFDTDAALQAASVAASTIASSTQATVMAAWKISSLGPSFNPLNYGPAANIIKVDHAASDVIFDFGDYTSSRQSTPHGGSYLDNNHIAEFYRATGGTQAIIIDGTTLISGAKTTGPASTGTYTVYFRGELAELFILKTDIGSSPRATTRANMGSYYGITVA